MIPLPAWPLRMPGWVWALLGVALLLGSVYVKGRWDGKAACEASFASAERRADKKAVKVAEASSRKAEAVTGVVTKETADVVERVRTVVRTLPATCPDVPDELRERIQRQVEAARARVSEAARNTD